jgi:hypothetical protein
LCHCGRQIAVLFLGTSTVKQCGALGVRTMSNSIFVSGDNMLPGDMLTGRIKFLFSDNPPDEFSTISKYKNIIVLSTLNCDLVGITVMMSDGEITHKWFNGKVSDTLYEVFR